MYSSSALVPLDLARDRRDLMTDPLGAVSAAVCAISWVIWWICADVNFPGLLRLHPPKDTSSKIAHKVAQALRILARKSRMECSSCNASSDCTDVLCRFFRGRL